MRFVGRIVAVTGAASGIGAACVERFRAEGARVASIDVATPSAAYADVFSIHCDVSLADDVKQCAASIRESIGSPDIVVNAAAVSVFQDTVGTNEEQFHRVFDVNVLGVINVCRALAPAMKEERFGSIVNISSITGILGAPGLSAYSASKGAIITLTRTLALELAESNVRVNCVCPASVDTPMLRAGFERSGDPARARELNIRRHPLGRLGTPEDIASLVLFLASDEASWITGGTYVIDGGASIARRWKE
jgi:2-keto-3-deoxy-L-fuconate dehydrogenase